MTRIRISILGIGLALVLAWGSTAGGRAAVDADFSGNGQVDFADFILLASAFGSGAPRFDLDGSGRVDFGDFVSFVSVYGQEVESGKVAVIRGMLRDALGRGLYGATVRTRSDSTRTDRTGAFEVPADSSGTTAVEIDAPGYVGQALEVVTAGSDTTLEPAALRSRNLERLLTAAAASEGDSAGVAAAIREMGFAISDDPATSQGFAGSHINGLARLEQAKKQMSLGEIAEELALLGVTFNGLPIADGDLVGVLQAMLDAALANPEDPRGFLMLQLFSNPDGSLPEEPPTLTEETLLSPTRAMALLSAMRLTAEHAAEVPAGTVFPSEGDLKTRVARSWQEVPLWGGQLEEGAAPTVDPAPSGGLFGMRLGWDQAGDLGLDAKEGPSLPYHVGGEVVTRGGLGGTLAGEIFKLTTNTVGEAVAPGEFAEALLTQGGEIETPSGTLVPERDYRIASGERKPKFEGLAGYGISPRFRVDSRDEPGGVSTYAVGPRFKLDMREIVSSRHSAESQVFVLDLR